MQRWKISFWTPGNMPKDDGRTFGCASHGFCSNITWTDPRESAVAFWEYQPEGIVLSGAYSDILEKLKGIKLQPTAAIAVFSKSIGVEDFIEGFRAIKGEVPMLGGVAALANNQAYGEILPKAEEAALFMILEDGFAVESSNIHTDVDERIKIERNAERIISRIKPFCGEWQNSLNFFRNRQRLRGMDEEDFETLTFSDINGRNVHCSATDTSLKTGANLPEDDILVVRETNHRGATKAIASFLSTERTLICGCAGLRSLLDSKVYTGKNSLAGFLFGEVITINQKPMFGNLMMVKLKKLL